MSIFLITENRTCLGFAPRSQSFVYGTSYLPTKSVRYPNFALLNTYANPLYPNELRSTVSRLYLSYNKIANNKSHWLFYGAEGGTCLAALALNGTVRTQNQKRGFDLFVLHLSQLRCSFLCSLALNPFVLCTGEFKPSPSK